MKEYVVNYVEFNPKSETSPPIGSPGMAVIAAKTPEQALYEINRRVPILHGTLQEMNKDCPVSFEAYNIISNFKWAYDQAIKSLARETKKKIYSITAEYKYLREGAFKIGSRNYTVHDPRSLTMTRIMPKAEANVLHRAMSK